MSDHLHSTFVESCYRCHLSRDELEYIDLVVAAVLHWDEFDDDNPTSREGIQESDAEYGDRYQAIADLLDDHDAKVRADERTKIAAALTEKSKQYDHVDNAHALALLHAARIAEGKQ